MNDDTIKRFDAIKAVMQKPAIHGSEGSWYHTDDIRDALEAVPSADKPKEDYNRGYRDAVQGIADEMVKQGKYIVQNRPQGEWMLECDAEGEVA